MSGKKPTELDYDDAPDDLCYLIAHFYAVKRCRGERISYSELKCYSELTSNHFESWEVEIIMRIDLILEASLNE